MRIPSTLSLTSPAAVERRFLSLELQHRERSCNLLPSRLFPALKSSKIRGVSALDVYNELLGGLKPFSIVSSAFLQRAYDQDLMAPSDEIDLSRMKPDSCIADTTEEAL